MERIYTHYDNLKVARDAPPEVIRAAYKSLAHKYHPDRNQNNPGASRIMSLINIAYEELSDPVKRGLYDEWIREQEKLQRAHSPENVTTNNKTEDSSIQRSTKNKRSVLLFLAAIIVLATILLVDFQDTDKKPLSGPINSNIPSTLSAPYSLIFSTRDIPYPHKKSTSSSTEEYQLVRAYGQILRFPIGMSDEQMAIAIMDNEHVLNPNYKGKGSKLLNKFSDAGEKEILDIKDISPNKLSVKSPCVRSATAPNGEMWPSTAAYVKGYKKLHADGLSSVTVDNTQNNSDVFVKLVSISENNGIASEAIFHTGGRSIYCKQGQIWEL
jgi:curved DNA-binding protein CbpA